MLSVILSCESIDDSIDYYTKKLGFTLNWRLADEDDRATFAGIRIADCEILLGTIDFVPEGKRETLGAGIQVYLNLPPALDLEKLFQEAQSSGADIVRPLETRDWGEKAFVVNDPDGYNLMFAQPPASSAS
jgi:uncharacterized glyoxalase superfamily protein PhnB